MPERTIVDTFLTMVYQNAGEGSHIFTVVGVAHVPNTTVYQNYRGQFAVETGFWSLFRAVQQTLDDGELCVVMLRSLLTMGQGEVPLVLLRAWSLTPVGIIPITGEDLAQHATQDPASMGLTATGVVYANGWDQDLDIF